MNADLSLSRSQTVGLILSSWFLVAFGQPAWQPWMGLIASCVGFALFWRVLLTIPFAKSRFWTAFLWYGSIQLVQFSWLVTHPFLYIIAVLLFCCIVSALPAALTALWMKPKNLDSWLSILGLASLWTVTEWTRLFILSGLPFNPAGMALTGSIYSLQLAAVGGVYLLSFCVIFTNLLVLRFWLSNRSLVNFCFPATMILLPYVFGAFHIYYHNQLMQQESKKHHVLLVQTAFPIEENIAFQSADEAREFVLNEWSDIFVHLRGYQKEKVDLILLPEYVVPYGTFLPVFHQENVDNLLSLIFGENILEHRPLAQPPYATTVSMPQHQQVFVTNAYILQTLAHLFSADIVVGLEDSEYEKNSWKKLNSFSSAFHFSPKDQLPSRYEKRVLMPMGEYIPFEFCREMAAKYGVSASFTPGTEAKIFQGTMAIGPTVCYEEMFGDLMRENRIKGAELLVNLTNDGWYPNSRLTQQHFDHALLRTVENGIPLARSCNTGITGAVDCLGRVINIFGDDPMESQETPGAILVDIPAYHYATVYTLFGDRLVVLTSSFILFACLIRAFIPKR